MKRIVTLDVLRGFALMGIIFINIGQMVFTTSNISELDYMISSVLDATISHRFFVIFSFLFGVGFHMFVSRAKEKGNRAGLLFVRRLLILMLFGAVHQYFQPGESLLIYAIIGFLLLPFYRVKPTIVLWLGIIFTAMGCYLGYPVLILGMFLLGHWTGSIGLFQYTERYLRGLRITQFTALLLIVPLYFVQESIMDYTGSPDISLAVGGLPVSLFYVTTLTVLMQREKVQRLLVPLGNLGRMALTNYLMQTVIILTLAHVLDWHDSVHQLTLMMAAVAILIVQMICSSLWLKYFRMGPVEYLWRLGTYGKAFPNYKRVNTD